MITCSNCGFSIDSKLKYSIKTNTCPSCGSSIMTKKQTEILSYIKSRLSAQRFSKDFEEDLFASLSMFIYSEFVEYEEDSDLKEAAEEEEEEEEVFEEEENLQSLEEEISDYLEKTENSTSEESDLDESSELLSVEEEAHKDESIEDRAARLKRKYVSDRKNRGNGSLRGVMVNRVSG